MKIEKFVLGSIENNTYLIADPETREAAVVDPAIPSRKLVEAIRNNNYTLKYLLITHAHFDHIGGVAWLKHQFNEEPAAVLHKADLELWEAGGGAGDFGFGFDAGYPPEVIIDNDHDYQLGDLKFRSIFTPGHTPGHVTFYFKASASAFCGDLIFLHGVGRTDLPYSSSGDLLLSIRQKIFTLPDDTVLYPGHGPSTTVSEEKQNNPFLQ